MNRVLMPRSTALWLLKNTRLSLKQISDFCGIDVIELNQMKHGLIDSTLQETDPILMGQLSEEEIKKCEEDHALPLKLYIAIKMKAQKRKIPYRLKKKVPNCILWLHNNYPGIPHDKMAKFFGIKIKEVDEIIENNSGFMSTSDPCLAGLCTKQDLDTLIQSAENPIEAKTDDNND